MFFSLPGNEKNRAAEKTSRGCEPPSFANRQIRRTIFFRQPLREPTRERERNPLLALGDTVLLAVGEKRLSPGRIREGGGESSTWYLDEQLANIVFLFHSICEVSLDNCQSMRRRKTRGMGEEKRWPSASAWHPHRISIRTEHRGRQRTVLQARETTHFKEDGRQVSDRPR